MAFIIIIIIISAHKSDLSNPWSQTQASLSIPSLHPPPPPKKKKQEQKNKSKDPPRISERQIDKQARQTKCQDHTNCRYRTRVAKHTPPVAGGGGSGQSSVETRSTSIATRKITRYSSAAFKSTSLELKR